MRLFAAIALVQASAALLLATNLAIGANPKPEISATADRPPARQDPKSPAPDPKWLDRLPKEDRAAIDELLGYAPPPLGDDLNWLGAPAQTWDDMRGRVVVVQSWSSANTAGRKWPERVAEALAEFDAKDLRIIALHTPEGADSVEAFLARKPLGGAAPDSVTVVVDSKGATLDALGIFKRPVNFVIDRQGTVRYAGLSMTGLPEAVTTLVAEPFDSSKPPAAAPIKETAASAGPKAEFPPIGGSVGNARDLRGKSAPDMYVAEWITNRPNANGKVVVLDFWATWCGPCVASIPHMNDLATRFAGDVIAVGISDEDPEKFERGMKDKKLALNSFKYALALDSAATMKKAIGITAIPHALVMDSDWIVRWQGHPTQLTPAILEQIVRADRGGGGGGAANGAKPGRRRGWNSDQ